MRIIDITGPIFEGMWDYGGESRPFRFGKVKMEYAGVEYELDSLENMLATTGTYFEIPGHQQGYTLEDVPLDKLFMVDSYVLHMPYKDLKIVDGRPCIDIDDMKNAQEDPIPEDSGIIMATGYGINWKSKDYLANCPFISKKAMDYLISRKPSFVVWDTPAAENEMNPEYVFDDFFKADILSVTACINLEKIKKYKVRLVVLPIRLTKMQLACPARAIVIEE